MLINSLLYLLRELLVNSTNEMLRDGKNDLEKAVQIRSCRLEYEYYYLHCQFSS